MSQQALNEARLEEIAARIGRENGKFTSNPITEYRGANTHGLMVADSNSGVVAYGASFPCRSGRGRSEVCVGVHHFSALESSRMAGVGIGCPSPNNLSVFLPQYPQGPRQFARAIQSITCVPIIWHLVARQQANSELGNAYREAGDQLRKPANNTGNPPEMLVHQDTFVHLRRGNNGVMGPVVFGTGQRVTATNVVLVSMYHPADRMTVRVQKAAVMADGAWFRYQVVPA